MSILWIVVANQTWSEITNLDSNSGAVGIVKSSFAVPVVELKESPGHKLKKQQLAKSIKKKKKKQSISVNETHNVNSITW